MVSSRLTAIFLAIFLAFSLLAANILAQEQNDLKDLWIDFSVGRPLVELFNRSANSNDIARVEHISQLDMLREITVGKKLVVFKSASDAIRLLPHIYNEIDIIGYNLEHGPANPINEQEDPITSIRSLREAADEYDLQIALGPDHSFAESDAVAMAPYADYLILQIQKVQTEPETVYDFVLPIIEGARRANPDIEISVQIRTEGDVDALLEMISPLQGQINGISILTSDETVPVAEELMADLRGMSQAAIPTPVEEELPAGTELMPDAVQRMGINAQVKEPTPDADLAPLETVVASVLEDADAPEVVLSAQTSGDTVSTAEANQRTGSTWLLIIMALIAGVALGAGFISYRTGS